MKAMSRYELSIKETHTTAKNGVKTEEELSAGKD